MPLFSMRCFQGIFKRENGPLRHYKEGKRPINANGQFSGTPPWWKRTSKKAHSEVYDHQLQDGPGTESEPKNGTVGQTAEIWCHAQIVENYF